MRINYGARSYSSDNLFNFEVHYFRLKMLRQSAIGLNDLESPLFVLDRGVERLEPRSRLFTGSPSLWVPPSLVQTRALLFQFQELKDVWQSLEHSPATPSRLAKSGVKRFFMWRFLCELLDIPLEPLKKVRIREIHFGQDVSAISKLSLFDSEEFDSDDEQESVDVSDDLSAY